MSTLLDGVRVLDLTRLLPGGFATGLLADLGAEVIKIERPGIGDYMRWAEPRIGEESAASWVVDRGKRSIGLDLKEPRGVDVLRRLVATADVLIESFRPGVAARLGIDYDALRELQPRLVYCSLSGYGQDGPLAGEAGHDLNYVGRAGLLSISGWRDRLPAIPGVQVADLGGSLIAVAGILAGLVHAERTGTGDHVDVSLTDSAFALLSIHLGDYFASDVVPERERMPLNGLYPCYNVYACADGKCVAVGALEERFFAELCEAVGRPDLAATHLDPDAVPAWRSLFQTRPRDEWLALLEGRDACVGPVNDLGEACAEPLFAEREMIVRMDHPDGGSVRQVGVPVKAREHPGRVGRAAPKLGEGTKQYLSEVGYSAPEMEELLAAGVVATAPATSA